jgi:hypothetical protein
MCEVRYQLKSSENLNVPRQLRRRGATAPQEASMSTAAVAPALEKTYWYSITTVKYDPETKTSQHGLFLQKDLVVKETDKFITIEKIQRDGTVYSYRTKKVSDSSYGWFSGHYPTVDAAKEAYREFCSQRLTALSEQFAHTTLELSQVDSLVE